ncbi:MAG: amidohydrolase [Balneolales bacterium]
MYLINKRSLFSLIPILLLMQTSVMAQTNDLKNTVEIMAEDLEAQVIEWRRHFHEFPELSNREFETSKKIASYLEELGLEVQTGIAHTGVVGILETGNPGPVIGLRADMDALPVVERVDIPFASKVKTVYEGQDVGVMHACGHDTHIAMLMGVATILTEMRDELNGTIKFIFQPAEEGAPQGEEGGAELMVKEGVLKNPDVDVIFGQHISSGVEVGKVNYKPEGYMASADIFRIKITGKQTHGSTPWTGIDPIVISSQIITGLQTIVSRQLPLTKNAAVITVGKINGGVRENIISEELVMSGTMRSLNAEMRTSMHEKIRLTATKIAESAGAHVEVIIEEGPPVTYNDPDLMEKMLPTLQETAGNENVNLVNARTGYEDFSYYQKEIPGLMYHIGGKPSTTEPGNAAPHHTPDFYIDESGMKLGVKMLSNLAIDYMKSSD